MSNGVITSGAENAIDAAVGAEQDDAIKNTIDTICWNSANWSDMNPEQRADSLDILGNFLMDSWNLKNKPSIECLYYVDTEVEIDGEMVPQNEAYYGVYIAETNQIVLNRELVCESDDFSEAIETIIHESMHAFIEEFDNTIDDGTDFYDDDYFGSVHERLTDSASDWTDYQLEECKDRNNEHVESISDRDIPDLGWILGGHTGTGDGAENMAKEIRSIK